jgi:hypothetical protein
MKHLIPIMLLIIFAVSGAGAQADQAPERTSIAPSARFEIVQSELAARWTFRLDKFCGRVSQLVSTSDDELTWEDMPVAQRPVCATTARFQIFTSGLAARHTFMVDTQTGKTWQLETSGDVTGWFLLKE